jgi:hypothetical protein
MPHYAPGDRCVCGHDVLTITTNDDRGGRHQAVDSHGATYVVWDHQLVPLKRAEKLAARLLRDIKAARKAQR